MKMYPMSLWESGESNGTVSLKGLFDSPQAFEGSHSGLGMDGLIFAICRGGWPKAVNNKTARAKLEVARDLFRQICGNDISSVDNVKRNPLWAEAILRSYARNICTLSAKTTIYADVSSTSSMANTVFHEYLEALEKLFIVDDIVAWNPSIRSKTAIRASSKRNLIDPSIAVAALGASPDYFNEDFKTLGFLFESLCVRDLRIYSSVYGGRVSYYRDRYGLEADAVLHLEDGRYALIEMKLGAHGVDEGAKHLCKIEDLIKAFNVKNKQMPLRLPSLKIVISGTEYGYLRDDGVLVIPIACLKN